MKLSILLIFLLLVIVIPAVSAEEMLHPIILITR